MRTTWKKTLMLSRLTMIICIVVIDAATTDEDTTLQDESHHSLLRRSPQKTTTTYHLFDQDSASFQLLHRDRHMTSTSCEEDDTFFVIMSCDNVCGVNGLEFKAEKFFSLCEFVSDSNDALQDATDLGCPNVGSNR